MHQLKKKLRNEVVRLRDLIPLNVRKNKDRMIRERLIGLSEYRKAKTVLFFASFRTEVDTEAIIRSALKNDKRVILPKVDLKERVLKLYWIKDLKELKPGCMGIPEPSVGKDRTAPLEDVEFIMMPGVAFDERGRRLGYGGAYYDRLIGKLKRRPPLVAVAYEEQIVDEVPVADHDVRVNKIVTDERVIEVENEKLNI